MWSWYVRNNITTESRDYTPPFVYASIGQNWGGGLHVYAGS